MICNSAIDYAFFVSSMQAEGDLGCNVNAIGNSPCWAFWIKRIGPKYELS